MGSVKRNTIRFLDWMGHTIIRLSRPKPVEMPHIPPPAWQKALSDAISKVPTKDA
jgi:hypothetical protein